MKQQASGNILAGVIPLNLAKGCYKQIIVNIVGTNLALNTLLVNQVGRLRIVRKDGFDVNVAFDALVDINNAEGASFFNSAIGAAITAQVRYNFYLPNDKLNVMKAEDSSEVQVQFTIDPAVAGIVAAWTVTISAVESKGYEKYLPAWIEYSQQLGTVGQRIVPQIQEQNINKIYIQAAALLGMIQVQKDGNELFNDTSLAAQGETQDDNKLPATPTYILLNMNKVESIGEIVSNKVVLYLTSASVIPANLVLYYQSIKFNSSRTQQSKLSFDRYQRDQVAKSPQATAVVAVGQSAS